MRAGVLAAWGLVFALAQCGDDDPAPSPVANDAGSVDAVADAGAPIDGSFPSEAGPILEPTEPAILASSDDKDEDPCLFRAADGTFYFLFFSNRGGADRIWLQSSPDAKTWTEPRAITATSDHAFYPSLTQTSDGRFHLVTWHGSVGDGGKIVGRIAHYSSADAVSWSDPDYVTDAMALAWTPTIVAVGTKLVVTWASDITGDKDIYVATSDTGPAWSAPTKVTSNAFNDDLPFLAKRPDDTYLLVWNRYAASVKDFGAPYEHGSNEVVFATSPDAKSWTDPTPVTNDGAVPDVIASVFPSAAGFTLAWASINGISLLPLSAVPATATNVKHPASTIGGDYSARLIPAGPPNLYLYAWVSPRPPSKGLDIWSQLVRLE